MNPFAPQRKSSFVKGKPKNNPPSMERRDSRFDLSPDQYTVLKEMMNSGEPIRKIFIQF